MTSCQQPSLSQLCLMPGSIFGFIVILLGGALNVQAQDNNTPQRGFHPAAPYALTDLETINTVNGTLMFHLPLAAPPDGRGRSPGT